MQIHKYACVTHGGTWSYVYLFCHNGKWSHVAMINTFGKSQDLCQYVEKAVKPPYEDQIMLDIDGEIVTGAYLDCCHIDKICQHAKKEIENQTDRLTADL